MSINWKNTSENLIISIIMLVVGVVIGGGLMYLAMVKVLESNQKVLIEAVNKSTTEIKNETNIKKIKKANSEIDNAISLDTLLNKKHRFHLFKK